MKDRWLLKLDIKKKLNEFREFFPVSKHFPVDDFDLMSSQYDLGLFEGSL